ncbi:hypothetical protein BWQ96_00598 [Gracilariopsis chorda]|uniref:Uncharacterized protein n=1 Tax=Gracilariopsis chorda TaxID=448386 RepID=A0A2V3J511_9FLOR|nr:hypothetical protein BWQ96_00598 [Gracilariopsis chorda]|eukprot:PXF49528.1 hypothetical protein BWQ96_00598 [Gracilariopsis chorda]
MSLTSDLLIKTVEVAAASFFTNSVATQHLSRNRNLSDTDETPPPLLALLRQVIALADHVADSVQSGGESAKRWQKLAICLAIDLAGAGSLSFPFIGDVLDVFYAPLSAVMVHALFASPLWAATAFAEEILPATDAFPTATIAWVAENHQYLSSLSAPSREA